MNKTEIKDSLLGEKYYVAEHQSGLKIYVCEKPVFKTTYAVFGTNYGSIDNVFRIKGEKEFTQVPAGIAHYLEHKLFESEDGDAFARYSKTGASANAYTSYDRTCYLFTCTDNFEDSFKILLDFVQHPYFTEQTVQKEQGIIGQEISMYDDAPDWVLLLNLFEALYHNNPVKINIAGTKETISHINADLLYKCYNTFYNLNNMFIVVAGNVNTDRILELCDKYLKPSEKIEIETAPYNEPDEIVRDFVQQEMEVANHQFALGIKYPVVGFLDDDVFFKIKMILSIIFGSQSAFYNDMVKSGLINKEFSASCFEGRNFASVIFDGESSDPVKVKHEIINTLDKYKKTGISADDFEPIKREAYGRYVRSFDDVENVGYTLTNCALTGLDMFNEGKLISSITLDELNDFLRTGFDMSKSALSVITPKGKKIQL